MPGSTKVHGRPAPQLPASALSFLRRTLGEFEWAQDLSWDHGESAVWLVEAASGPAIIKSYRQPRKFRQELTAYREWLPQLENAAEWRLPRLLAAHEEARLLVLTWLPGELLLRTELEAAPERLVHSRAGKFLRALHDLPFTDADELPLATAYSMRTEAWLDRAADCMPGAAIDWVRSRAQEARDFIGAQERRPCHRDFSPRNWLVEAAHPLRPPAIIDFEHSRADLLVLDFYRLWSEVWPARPDLREAFLEGYGRELTAGEEETLERHSPFIALTTVVWSFEHADREFELRGWEELRRLGMPERFVTR